MESVNYDTLDDMINGIEVSDFGPPDPAEFNLPDVTPQKINKWDPRLLLDMALGIDPLEEILSRYSISEEELDRLSRSPFFRRELAQTIKDIRDNGVAFSSKAKVQAEMYLEVLDAMIQDSNTPASIRLEAIRSTVKWGRLEPKEDKTEAQNATQVNVNITFG